jgi:hypothetical protein
VSYQLTAAVKRFKTSTEFTLSSGYWFKLRTNNLRIIGTADKLKHVKFGRLQWHAICASWELVKWFDS